MNHETSKADEKAEKKPRVDLWKHLLYLVGASVFVVPLYALIVGFVSSDDSYSSLYDALHNPSPFITLVQNWSLFAIAVSTSAAIVFYQEHHNHEEDAKFISRAKKFKWAFLLPVSALAITFVIQFQWQARVNHAVRVEKYLDLLQGHDLMHQWQDKYRFARMRKNEYEKFIQELKQAYDNKTTQGVKR